MDATTPPRSSVRLCSTLALAAPLALAACLDAPPLDVSQAEQATICGGSDEMQFVNDYNGTLGPSVAYVQANKRTSGAMEDLATATSRKYCSGTLIGANLFLTANHCLSTTTVGQFVAFNYERAAGSTSVLPQSHYRIDAVLEAGLGADFAILRLAGNPGATWGIAPVAAADPPVGAAITIMGHAKGGPKKIEAGTVRGFTAKTLTYDNIDTLGGQSGSAILNAAGEVVGVHTNGGCLSAGGGFNFGQRISAIRAGSSIL